MFARKLSEHRTRSTIVFTLHDAAVQRVESGFSRDVYQPPCFTLAMTVLLHKICSHSGSHGMHLVAYGTLVEMAFGFRLNPFRVPLMIVKNLKCLLLVNRGYQNNRSPETLVIARRVHDDQRNIVQRYCVECMYLPQRMPELSTVFGAFQRVGSCKAVCCTTKRTQRRWT